MFVETIAVQTFRGEETREIRGAFGHSGHFVRGRGYEATFPEERDRFSQGVKACGAEVLVFELEELLGGSFNCVFEFLLAARKGGQTF